MPLVLISAVDTKVFTPITVRQVTVTGDEAWRTAQRVGPTYGILGLKSRVMPPTNQGISQHYRYQIMQGANPTLPYKLGMLEVNKNG